MSERQSVDNNDMDGQVVVLCTLSVHGGRCLEPSLTGG